MSTLETRLSFLVEERMMGLLLNSTTRHGWTSGLLG